MKVSHLAILSVVILACMGIFFTILPKQPLSQNGRQWDSKIDTTSDKFLNSVSQCYFTLWFGPVSYRRMAFFQWNSRHFNFTVLSNDIDPHTTGLRVQTVNETEVYNLYNVCISSALYSNARYERAHRSDLLRIYYAYALNCAYIDSDIIMLEEMPQPPWLVYTYYWPPLKILNGALAIDEAFFNQYRALVAQHYDPNCWTCVGSALFEKVLPKILLRHYTLYSDQFLLCLIGDANGWNWATTSAPVHYIPDCKSMHVGGKTFTQRLPVDAPIVKILCNPDCNSLLFLQRRQYECSSNCNVEEFVKSG